MAKQQNVKVPNAVKRDSAKVREMKEDYLVTVYQKEKNLKRWKRREGWRSFFGFLMVLAVLAGIAAAVYMWYVDRFEITDQTLINIAICLGAGIGACIVLGLIRLAISCGCKKAYISFNTKAEHADIKLDNLKREKIDTVLQNQIVISVRSVFETLIEYEKLAKGEPEDDEDYDYFDESECGDPEHKIFTGSVDSALVYIDNNEAGALDLDSPFSCFRVEPGLHSLKLVIKKTFPGTNKCLVLETPVNPINLDGDYRIVVYTLTSKHLRGNIKYKLQVTEYDDMVIFMREGLTVDEFAKWYKMDEMSYHLWKRATKLHKQIYGEVESEEETEARERGYFGDETVTMEQLSERIRNNYHDARFSSNQKMEIHATFSRSREKNQ